MTPQLRSRQQLTNLGYLVATVEGKKKFPQKESAPCTLCRRPFLVEISADMFNVFDVIAIHPVKCETVLVQTTDRSHHSHRRNKILSSMEVKLCLKAGLRVLLQSWKKNDKINRWELAEEWFTLADFKQAPHYPSTVTELIEIRRKAKQPDLPAGTTLFKSPILDTEVPF